MPLQHSATILIHNTTWTMKNPYIAGISRPSQLILTLYLTWSRGHCFVGRCELHFHKNLRKKKKKKSMYYNIVEKDKTGCSDLDIAYRSVHFSAIPYAAVALYHITIPNCIFYFIFYPRTAKQHPSDIPSVIKTWFLFSCTELLQVVSHLLVFYQVQLKG